MFVLSRFGRRFRSAALLLATAGGLGALPAAAQSPSLSATLDLVHAESGRGRVAIRFNLRNDGAARVQFLRWQTPFEGFRSEIFTVVCAGRELPYLGPTVKRGAPSANDYFEIGARETLSAVVDLAEVYDLPAEPCEVRFQGIVLDAVVADAPPRLARFAGRPVTLVVSPLRLPAGGSAPRLLAGQTYVGCDAGQERALAAAVPAGGGLASSAQTYLDGVPPANRPADRRYNTWFGTYDASRYSTVSTRYGQISGAAAGSLTLDCTGSGKCGGVTVTCDPGDFAFTCAGGASKTIWLCSGFFAAPATGYNSQAGTIVHELSHWYGTRDDAYGCSSCQSLASSSPTKAVGNADNNEYFAENFGLTCP